MYERFTDRARKVMQLANQEAQRLNHECIGTQHILLGLVKEGSGAAAQVLKKLGVDLRDVRAESEKLIQPGQMPPTMGKLPQTPRAKQVIEYAMEEARNLNHNYVGTEHLLLGLLREQEGVAAQVLMNLGLKLEGVRATAVSMLADFSQTQFDAMVRDVLTLAAEDEQYHRNVCEKIRRTRTYEGKLDALRESPGLMRWAHLIFTAEESSHFQKVKQELACA